MLTYDDLHNKPSELLAVTGLNQDEFETLLVAFGRAYAEALPAHHTRAGQVRQRGPGGGNKSKLHRSADQLLFILVYHKTYPLQTLLGLHFGLSQGRVNAWLHRLTPVLQQALAAQGHTPVRDGADVQTSALVVAGGADLIIDGTERRRQRPRSASAQKEHYSGKKKRTRIKTLYWSISTAIGSCTCRLLNPATNTTKNRRMRRYSSFPCIPRSAKILAFRATNQPTF